MVKKNSHLQHSELGLEHCVVDESTCKNPQTCKFPARTRIQHIKLSINTEKIEFLGFEWGWKSVNKGLHRANEVMANTLRNVSMGLNKNKPTSWIWYYENSNHTRYLMKCAKEETRLRYQLWWNRTRGHGRACAECPASAASSPAVCPRTPCHSNHSGTSQAASLSLSLCVARKVLDERWRDGVYLVCELIKLKYFYFSNLKKTPN